MSKIISMREYVRDKVSIMPTPPASETGEPYINDSQVWSKDYSKLESVVFGVLKIREVLNYYLYYEDVWAYLLLNLLDAAAHATPEDHSELAEAAAHVRNYMVQAVDAGNRKNMQAALLILDLIEKAPGFRAQVLGLPQEKAAD
ncbi:hypothetical protein [Fundidesulfovibrio terrae]|uniref:hypothetical protein n=1 Tax=Fundidesulfovibrio terrae TaxID=2922866 RepID=UPI001FAECD8C|nr:hypothetical protein [Fundidesulfovibrio terrae]